MRAKLPIVLEEKPDRGQTPLSDIARVMEASAELPKPKATPIIREAVRAYAQTIDLINQARAIGLCDAQDYPSICKYALTQAIKFRQFQLRESIPNTKGSGNNGR